jgi:hypothetical protein
MDALDVKNSLLCIALQDYITNTNTTGTDDSTKAIPALNEIIISYIPM